MTAAPDNPSRQLACAQCGAVFACNLAGGCWCAEEPYRVPMPETAAQDCLCPACLRKLAAASPDTVRRSDIP
ncbi:MAG: hypothetical protein PSV22_12690 [Pseudolabrys sp.]|nr:hypothetical protein [Pseudolabrys sp.]